MSEPVFIVDVEDGQRETRAAVEMLMRRENADRHHHPVLITGAQSMSKAHVGAMMAATMLAASGYAQPEVARPLDPFGGYKPGGMTEERRNAKRAKAAAKRYSAGGTQTPPKEDMHAKVRAKNKAARKARAKNRKR